MRWPTMPVGLLMMEHRAIERALANIPLELDSRLEKDEIPTYVDVLADFLHFYADRTHHRKEEDILFRQLAGKSPAAEITGLMGELLAEHGQSRELIGQLVDANGRLRGGDDAALGEIREILGDLVRHYSRHIEKEDRRFFKPSMAYFSPEERLAMLSDFSDLDRTMIHEKYSEVARALGGGEEPGAHGMRP